MALNAYVFCDCFEKGRLKTPPPFPDRITLDADGEVSLKGPNTLEEDLAFDDWRFNRACNHSGFVLIHRRIGNLWGIQWIREALGQISKEPEREFPVLRTKVVYSGSHGGDRLSLDDVRALREELSRLRETDLGKLRLTKEGSPHSGKGDPQPAEAQDLEFIRGVFSRLEEVVAVSLEVGRTISF